MLRRKVFNEAAQVLIDGDERCAVCAISCVTENGDEHDHTRDGIGYAGRGPMYASNNEWVYAGLASHNEWVNAGLEANLLGLAFAAVIKPEELRR